MKSTNLLSPKWTNLDSYELRLLLNERIGFPDQYHNRAKYPNKLYLPLAGASCRVVLTFKDSSIISIEPGPAFDPAQWKAINDEIEQSVLTGVPSMGRQYSFSLLRVLGWSRGKRSGVQIAPPADDAPRAEASQQITRSYSNSRSPRPTLSQ